MSRSGPSSERDLEGVATGEPLELAHRQLPRVAADPALAAAEGDVDDGGLEGHLGGQARRPPAAAGRGGSGSRPWRGPGRCCGGSATRGTPRRGRRPCERGPPPRAPGREVAAGDGRRGRAPPRAAASSMRWRIVAHGSYVPLATGLDAVAAVADDGGGPGAVGATTGVRTCLVFATGVFATAFWIPVALRVPGTFRLPVAPAAPGAGDGGSALTRPPARGRDRPVGARSGSGRRLRPRSSRGRRAGTE